MKTITFAMLVEKKVADEVKEKIIKFLSEQLGYEEDIDFMFDE